MFLKIKLEKVFILKLMSGILIVFDIIYKKILFYTYVQS